MNLLAGRHERLEDDGEGEGDNDDIAESIDASHPDQASNIVNASRARNRVVPPRLDRVAGKEGGKERDDGRSNDKESGADAGPEEGAAGNDAAEEDEERALDDGEGDKMCNDGVD